MQMLEERSSGGLINNSQPPLPKKPNKKPVREIIYNQNPAAKV